MYMRNRYYDPKTGQFTQPDPIGLAGGLNAFGFANGDPVSYSDPYGLFKCPGSPGCPMPGTIRPTVDRSQPGVFDGWWDRHTNLAVSLTVGNRSVSQDLASGAVTHNLVANVPSVGASFDMELGAPAPPGTTTGTIDLGAGKHLGIGVNYVIDAAGNTRQVRSVTIRLGGSTPTSPVGVSVETKETVHRAPRGSTRREAQRVQEAGAGNRTY
jgi:hypothetical protein